MVEESCYKEAYWRRVVAKSNGLQIELLSQCFEGLSNPRATKGRNHKLTEQIVICVCAIIS